MNMGYVDGKTDTDLLLEEGDEEEDGERIILLKVSSHQRGNSLVLGRVAGFTCCNIHTHTRTHTHTHTHTLTHTLRSLAVRK